MLDLILVIFSLLWFCNTEFFGNWSSIKIGGDQFCISLSALIIVLYTVVGAFGAIRWYYSHRRY